MSSMVLSPTSLRLIFSACLAVLVPTQECRAQSSQQVIQNPPAQSYPTANPTDQSKADFKCESPEVVDKIKYLSVCILTDGKNFCQDANLNITKASEILKFNDEDLTSRCLSLKITDPRIPNICSFLPGEIKEVEMVSRQYAPFATAFDPNIQKYHCLINLTIDWKNQFLTIRKMMAYMFGPMIQQIPLPSNWELPFTVQPYSNSDGFLVVKEKLVRSGRAAPNNQPGLLQDCLNSNPYYVGCPTDDQYCLQSEYRQIFGQIVEQDCYSRYGTQ